MELVILLIIFLTFATGVGVVLGVTYFSYRGVKKVVQSLSDVSTLPRSTRDSLQESHHYGRLILKTVNDHPAGPLKDRLMKTTKPVEDWLNSLTRLEEALKNLYRQRNLSKELKRMDREINHLRRDLLENPKEARHLRELIASKKRHRATLEELKTFQTQAELKIRKISSDIGAMHAEIILTIARGDFNENRLNRLDQNLKEEVTGIRDILTVMDEMGYRQATSRH